MNRQPDSSQTPTRPPEGVPRAGKTRMLAAISRILAGSRAAHATRTTNAQDERDQQVEWALRLMS